MKLNNRGWGLRMMAILMSILMVFFLIAIFYIYRYYSIMNDTNYILIVKDLIK